MVPVVLDIIQHSFNIVSRGTQSLSDPGQILVSQQKGQLQKHKEDTGCSGVRNKTAFVTLSDFDEMALLNDYRLLEDTGRFAGGATRDKLIQTPRSTLKVQKLFLWHLKVIFPQSSTEFSQRRVSDRQTLEQILTPYIHPTESDPVTRQKLKMYVRTPFDHVKVFMKAEGRKANSVRFHELDIYKTLRDNLSYKTLIEYPVLHVVLEDHWKEFPRKGPDSLFPYFSLWQHATPTEIRVFCTASHTHTHTNFTSTATVAKERIKRGSFHSDLMSCEMTVENENKRCGFSPDV
uniref:Zinc finger HIT-type containing 6 n=1 Tax=Cyclopterus lumpus TaxID=8103 RepID=A0A8C2XNK4_CYCLU